jgi:hypothetical protein
MGLYDDDNESLASGDIALRDYWRAKFNAEMLEQALKTKQPEGAIGMELISALSLLDELLTIYPSHEDLKTWQARAKAIQAKIDPNFSRGSSFTSRCMWNEHSYREAFVGMHCGDMGAGSDDWELAYDCYRTAGQKLEFLNKRITAGEHVEGWPPETVAWIQEQYPSALRKEEAAGKKR